MGNGTVDGEHIGHNLEQIHLILEGSTWNSQDRFTLDSLAAATHAAIRGDYRKVQSDLEDYSLHLPYVSEILKPEIVKLADRLHRYITR